MGRSHSKETLIAFVVLHGLQNASLQCCTACISRGEQTGIVVPHDFLAARVEQTMCICACAYMCAGTYRQWAIHRLANVSYCENQKGSPEIHLAIVSVFATTTTVPFTTMLVVLVCLVTLGP
jgi:hypothetical protein